VSATVITFNEERDLAACLASLSWCDEIVLVDSGSLGFVQATVAYARKDPELAKPLQKHWESLQPPKIRVAV
jgi:hypothetical protein